MEFGVCFRSDRAGIYPATRSCRFHQRRTGQGEFQVDVIPIRLQSRLPKTAGLQFPEAHDLLPAEVPTDPAKARKPKGGRKQTDPKKRTRLQPPKDLVKLEDRLYFVLQPPLKKPQKIQAYATRLQGSYYFVEHSICTIYSILVCNSMYIEKLQHDALYCVHKRIISQVLTVA